MLPAWLGAAEPTLLIVGITPMREHIPPSEAYLDFRPPDGGLFVCALSGEFLL
jgi:hypothetical protein